MHIYKGNAIELNGYHSKRSLQLIEYITNTVNILQRLIRILYRLTKNTEKKILE